MSDEELMAERLRVLQDHVRELRDELNGYKRNGIRAVLAVAGYLAWVALHQVPALSGFFQ